jgi:hypothetical protein
MSRDHTHIGPRSQVDEWPINQEFGPLNILRGAHAVQEAPKYGFRAAYPMTIYAASPIRFPLDTGVWFGFDTLCHCRDSASSPR